MARHSLSSAFPPALRRLFQGTPDRRSRRGTGRGSSPSRPAGLSRRVRPRLEALEDRVTPSTFTTTTFADDGTAGSLRGALTQADADAGTATDTIQLQAGTYQLTIANAAGRHEQGNAQGDLNVTGTRHALVIRGTTDAQGNPTTTIQQTAAPAGRARGVQPRRTEAGLMGQRQDDAGLGRGQRQGAAHSQGSHRCRLGRGL